MIIRGKRVVFSLSYQKNMFEHKEITRRWSSFGIRQTLVREYSPIQEVISSMMEAKPYTGKKGATFEEY